MAGGWVWSNGWRREWIAVEKAMAGAARARCGEVAARIGLTRWVEADEARLPHCRGRWRTTARCRSLLDQQMLQAEELRRLGGHPLITIGGHTTSHPWLAALSETEALREITENRFICKASPSRKWLTSPIPSAPCSPVPSARPPGRCGRPDRRDRPARVRVPWA